MPWTNNDTTTQQLLVLAIAADIAVGVLGTVFAPDHTVQILGFTSVGLMQLINLFQSNRAAVKAQAAKDRAEVGIAVSKSNNEKLVNINKLVNGAHGEVLRTLWHALQRIAELTRLPEDAAAASLAKEIWMNHEAKADGKGKIAPEIPETAEETKR